MADRMQETEVVRMEYAWVGVVNRTEVVLMVRVWVGVVREIKVVQMEQFVEALTSKASFLVWLLFLSWLFFFCNK